MNKYLILIGVILICSAFVYSMGYTNSFLERNNLIEFKDSNWYYNFDVGFLHKDSVDVLEQQQFTINSRQYFLNELKNK